LEETSRFERQVVEQQLNESRIKKQLDQTDAEERISEKYERQYEDSVSVIFHSNCFPDPKVSYFLLISGRKFERVMSENLQITAKTSHVPMMTK